MLGHLDPNENEGLSLGVQSGESMWIEKNST